MQFFHLGRAAITLATLGLLTMAAATTTGCGGGQKATITEDSATAAQLRSAPDQVTLRSGQSLRLDAFLNRDFQPISPPDGKPMLAVLRVATMDGTPPSDIRVDSAWAVYGQEIWDVKPAEEQPPTPGNPYFEVVGRNGPKWGPNVRVDVIVQVRDGANTTYRLQAPQVLVSRSD